MKSYEKPQVEVFSFMSDSIMDDAGAGGEGSFNSGTGTLPPKTTNFEISDIPKI